MSDERTLLLDMQERRRMNSAEFTLYEHCFQQGLNPTEIWQFEEQRPCFGWNYIGWCPASSTVIPKSNWGQDYPLAVLLENDRGERAWCHVPATAELKAAAGLHDHRK